MLEESPSDEPIWRTIAAYVRSGKSGLFEPPQHDLRKLGKGLQALIPAA
jgi:hypothetical protein